MAERCSGAARSGGAKPALLICLLGALLPLLRAPRPVPSQQAELLEVIDGDGLRVRRGGRVESLRLSCVDSEEALHPSEFDARGKPQTVFGEETRLWLGERLAGVKKLELLGHTAQPERDGFERLLAHVRLPAGGDLGLELVRAGRSPYFTKYGSCALLDEDYRAAEAEARAAGRGIWSPATNRPAQAGAPAARRDYAALREWWDLRARAVDAFRAVQRRDPLGAVAADDRAGLARAAAAATPTPIFGEVIGARRARDGSLDLRFAGDLLEVRVAAEHQKLFADLDLERRSWSGHQNYLWIRARAVREGSRFSVRCRAAGDLGERPD